MTRPSNSVSTSTDPFGIVYLVATAVLFCVMGIMVRILVVDRQESVFWIGWVRFLVGGLAMVLPGLAGAWSLRVRNRPVFLLRGIVGSAGMFLLYVVIANVGLGRGTVLVYLMGVFGAVSGIVVLKERLRPAVAVAVALATAGVLLSCRAGIPRDAEWLAVVAAACSGVTLSLVRLLRRTDTNQVVFLSQGLFGTLLLLPFIFTTSPPSETVSWLLVAVMIAADISGQLCMNAGLARMPVATGASLMMLTPILSLVFGVVLFHEWLSPLQWFGCAVVLTASVLAVRKQSLQHAAEE